MPFIQQSQLAGLIIQGAQGQQGAVGAQGVQGIVGAQGPQGVQGTIGAQGVQGATGSQGTVGAQGAQGDTGAQGVQGATGAQGPQGVQGTIGAQGVQGATGPQGVQGATPAIGGSNTQIQFNNGGALGGSANLVFDGTKVGIGTSSPTNLLHLSSSGSTGQTITSVGTNVYSSVSFFNTTTNYGYDIGFGGSASVAPNSFYIYGGSSAGVKLIVSPSGDVVIGTATSVGKLTVSGSINSVDGALNVAGNGGFYNGANKFGLDVAGGNARLYSSGANSSTKGGFEFHTTDSTGALDTIAMFLNLSGFLGIGQTSPVSALDVYAGGAYAYSRYWRSDQEGYGARFGVADTLMNTAPVRACGVDGFNAICFGVQGSEKMRITSDGLVGIGTASPTTVKLSVFSGGAGTSGQLKLGYDATAYWQIGRLDPAGTGSGNFQFKPDGGASVFDITAAGSVGIGQISPTVKLDILNSNATFSLSQKIFNANAGTFWIGQSPNATFLSVDNFDLVFCTNSNGGVAGSSVPTNERMRINNVGNVGIGVSAISAWAKLEVLGTAGAQTGAAQQLSIIGRTTTAGQGAGIRLSAASGSNEAVGIIGVVNNASGTSGSMTFHVYNGGGDIPEYMRITNAGNVGIGTSSPANKLTVAVTGNATINTVASYASIFNSNDAVNNQYYGLAFTNSNTPEGGVQKPQALISCYAAGGSWGSNWAGDLAFSTATGGGAAAPTEKMRITAGGNVGIGTSSPVQKLQVNGAAGNPATSGSTQNGIVRLSNTTDNGVLDIGIKSGGTGAWLQSTDGGASGLANQYPLLLNPVGGNVGIGTSSPAQRLDVRALNIATSGTSLLTARGQAYVGTTDNWGQDIGGTLALGGAQNSADLTATYASISGRRESSLGYIYTGYMQLAVSDGTNMVERMRIDSSGNLGVGTTNPQFRLEVDGPLSFNNDAGRNMLVASTTSATAGYGGGIAFGGFYSGTSSFINDFAGIQGFKENGTAGDYAGALRFTTRINGGTPTERMRITSDGSVAITQTPGKYTIDVTGGATSIANGGTVDFPSASGMLIVNNWTDGQVTIYLCGGGSTGVVANVAGTQVGSFAYNAGVAGYRWTNNYGSTATFGFFFVRTRNTA